MQFFCIGISINATDGPIALNISYFISFYLSYFSDCFYYFFREDLMSEILNLIHDMINLIRCFKGLAIPQFLLFIHLEFGFAVDCMI